MHCFEDFPNELLLIIFSYLDKSELIESFYQCNQRFNSLLLKYISHIYLSTILTKDQLKQFVKIHSIISSLTVDNYQIGDDFLHQCNSMPLENFNQIKLIDDGIDCYRKILHKFQPEILKMVITSLNQENKSYQDFASSIKRLEIEFQIGEYAKNCLLNQFHSLSTSILVHIRLTCSKFSQYFQVFTCQYPMYIKKLNVSIFSIDKIDEHQPTIFFPYLVDFQLEICEIPFYLIHYLLPENGEKNSLERFAFIGQTTNIKARLWKILLNKYKSIERFDLHLSNVQYFQISDIDEWKYEFPRYSIDYNSSSNIFRIHCSKFDQLERLVLNESIKNLNHLDYLNKIHHLIIRSEYWCSFFHFSSNILNDLSQRFHRIKRLTTNYRQLEYLLPTNLLNQIERLDLEFTEKYCFIQSDIAKEFLQLKSLILSSIYEGIHSIDLHSTIKTILREKFSKIIYLYIDAIEIIDDEQVEKSISLWYSSQSNQPIIDYKQGKSLSIWF